MESNFIHLNGLLAYTWMKSSNTPRWSPSMHIDGFLFYARISSEKGKSFLENFLFSEICFWFIREKIRNFQEITNAKILPNKYGREIINYQNREFHKFFCAINFCSYGFRGICFREIIFLRNHVVGVLVFILMKS